MNPIEPTSTPPSIQEWRWTREQRGQGQMDRQVSRWKCSEKKWFIGSVNWWTIVHHYTVCLTVVEAKPLVGNSFLNLIVRLLNITRKLYSIVATMQMIDHQGSRERKQKWINVLTEHVSLHVLCALMCLLKSTYIYSVNSFLVIQ